MPEALLERAYEAAARRAWAEAYEGFREAEKAGILRPDDLPILAQVAYAAGHLDATIETWERIYAGSLSAGDNLTAAGAAVRVAMHLLFDTALMAPVRAWLARAERLLGDPGVELKTPVHAWLAVVRNYECMLSGDAQGARVWARRAIEIGGAQDRAAAAIGRIAEARSLILVGEVKEGLALIEEAGIAAVSGEIDPLSTGVIYCELVCALQGLAQIDLAEEWTNAMERWGSTNAIGSIHGRCRVHRAEILRFRGSFDRAESELRVACEELRPYVRRELGWPLYELGRVRLCKHDLDGAEEAFVAADNAGWEAQPGLALVSLARGDIEFASASIREAIARPSFVPSKELPPDTDLRCFPLLEAQVQIGIVAGGDELAHARAASEELSRIATKFGSKAFTASATGARGRILLTDGNAHEAERCFEQAARVWQDAGAPYEAAIARRAIAQARRAMGHTASADLELRAASAILERLGVPPASPSEPSAAPVPTTPPAPTPTVVPTVASPQNAMRLEGDTWAVTFDGRTIRVRDRKGMHYLTRMLEEPQREFYALDLVAAGASEKDLGDAGALLDATAKNAYRRRLSEIEEEIADAERQGDLGRAARASNEREIVVRELSRAFGIGDRERPTSGSAAERARVSVTRAIRQVLSRIAEYHPSLGAHLDHSIKTGAYCSYAPDPRAAIAWTTERG